MLCEYARTRSPRLREELTESFLPLARSLAMRYRSATEPADDLVQVASLGLVKAIDGFDPERGRPFTAYATPTILGELRRHFRDRVWTVRLPRALSELVLKIDDARTRLEADLGRSPTPAEIAGRLGIGVEEVLEGLEAAHDRRSASLDAPAAGHDDGSAAVLDTIGGAEPGYDRVEAEQAMRGADLKPREWRVLRLRFEDGLTQSEIGELLGVSQMQISRISRRALNKLLVATRGDDGAVAAEKQAA